MKNGPQKSRMLVRGRGIMCSSFQGKLLTPGREQMHLLQKERAHEPPFCLLPHCPLDLLSAFTLFSWPSSLSCSLPQFFLVTFSLCFSSPWSLSTLFSFSLRLPSLFPLTQSSRLSIGPLRSLWSKYFPGIEIELKCQF